jgi:hypothetical protein
MSGTRVRAGLSTITANMGNNNYLPPQGYKVGKVYAVILNDKSVPQNIWEANGEWAGIGTILYQEYNEDAEVAIEDITDNLLSGFPTALPLFPNQKYFPLPGEIVLLLDLPSAPSPITGKTEETYYLTTINAWNSPQFNGLFLNEDKSLLYNSFNENTDFRGLQTFEGDYILEGRFSNSIRFGSTNKSGAVDESPWSTNSGELTNNPIILITNQHNFKLPNSDLYVEDINKDGASIYLTSNQLIPLNIGNVKLSNITAPIAPFFYVDPQVVINADRTVISSKKDEVLIFGRSGVEIYSQGAIYFQSDEVGITLQDNAIFLGPYNNNGVILQPLVLGNNLRELLTSLYQALSNFSTTIVSAKSTPEGTTITEVAAAADALQTYLNNDIKNLENSNYLLSQTIYTL